MRLRFDEALVNHLDFHVLIRNLLRRLSALSYFHCGRQLNLDFKELIAQAQKIKADKTDLRWVDWTRYSNRQKRKIQMGGLIGQVTYSGPLAGFLPFLRLGELVHVGKGTVFGLGKYTLRIE
ncbi:MAG: CRISPR system precrRNA processing endoribonuclease RAMP protein Cas6 [bacterium]|uniref:CRISPR system precrRNA processing endoribonuclease RAMP protein Cas6 n=1 Tax=Candidatus Methylomirabilis tolerans TaxID=3123416 RepID=A0AAJ1AJP5_9BACT|nr:CRISPR system precrRNA processing endoribonuclease RAMP protein Cas6 [Candidatus Methylomirabilis sp.]